MIRKVTFSNDKPVVFDKILATLSTMLNFIRAKRSGSGEEVEDMLFEQVGSLDNVILFT